MKKRCFVFYAFLTEGYVEDDNEPRRLCIVKCRDGFLMAAASLALSF